MKLINSFVLNPDKYLLPNFLISPFNTTSIEENKKIKKSKIAKNYFTKRFTNYDIKYTISGREAIKLALTECNLKKEDCVTIFTTSENLYISGCVTKEIENFCSWSRKIEDNTKVIFINHEFGYLYPNIKKIKKYNLLIIEDYAHSFFLNENKKIEGDFAIYSFPKMFPIQIGGLLVSKKNIKSTNTINNKTINYINNVLSQHLQNKKIIIKKRLNNYIYLKKQLKKINITPFFKLSKNDIPGVFVFNVPSSIDLNDFKSYMNNNGIQSSVFYGKNAYFIPIHQNLSKSNLNYFIEVIKNYLKK